MQVVDEEKTKQEQEKAKEEAEKEGKEYVEPSPALKSVAKDVWDYRVQNSNKPIWARSPKDVGLPHTLAVNCSTSCVPPPQHTDTRIPSSAPCTFCVASADAALPTFARVTTVQGFDRSLSKQPNLTPLIDGAVAAYHFLGTVSVGSKGILRHYHGIWQEPVAGPTE